MNKFIKKSSILQTFKFAFGGMLGIMAAQTLIILYTAIFLGIGILILVKYNKKDTKLLDDIQPIQYIGIVFCVLGLLPWGQYLIFGLLEGIGMKVADDLF